MVVGLRMAGQAWQAYADAVIQGNRSAATLARPMAELLLDRALSRRP